MQNVRYCSLRELDNPISKIEGNAAKFLFLINDILPDVLLDIFSMFDVFYSLPVCFTTMQNKAHFHGVLCIQIRMILLDPDRIRHPGHDDPDPADTDRYQF